MDFFKHKGPVQTLKSYVACYPSGTLAKCLDLIGTVLVAKISCEKLLILP